MEINKKKLLELYPSFTSVLGPYYRKDGRQHVILNNSNLPKNDKNKRKTISYPKAVMESKLGRRLKPNEEVDHIDGNKYNDNYSNYQVISGTDNKKKQALEGNNKFWGRVK